MHIISRLLNLLINVEKIHETTKITVLHQTDALGLFKLIDINKRGYLNDGNFKTLLSNRGIFVKSEDLIGVMRRFNKNNSGRINFNDFSMEMKI